MENNKGRIIEILKANPRGLTITDISARININRNSVARYMDILTVSGEAEMRQLGPAKVFYLSNRVPISALLNFSSDYILVLDNDLKIIQINENFLELANIEREGLIGQGIKNIPNFLFKSKEMYSGTREALDGKEIVFEKRFHVAGAELYLDITMLPTILEDGSQGVTWILKNITERKKAEKIIEDLAKFPSENPNPVLRIAKNGKIIYSNTAGSILLTGWNREIGQTVPRDWQQRISDIFHSKESREIAAEYNNRIFSFFIVPVTGAGYVNIYGRDITNCIEEELK